MIQKSNKENSVVILDKDVYIKHTEPLVRNKPKFKNVGTKERLTKFYCKPRETNQQIFQIFKINRGFKC